MQLLRNKDVAPPEDGEGRNFRFIHRETGHWSEARDYYTWQERIAAHRRSNGLEPVAPSAAEDQLCQTLPPGWCSQSRDGARPSVFTRFGWQQVVEGTKAFLKVVLSGFVPQAEANRRAAICTGCYFNVNPSGCGTCHKIASLVTGEVGGRSTPFDSSLKACGVCTCALKAMVHFPLESLAYDMPDKQAKYPDFCWQKIGGENYRAQVSEEVSREAHTLESSVRFRDLQPISDSRSDRGKLLVSAS